jgi:hypothetical protein
VLLSKEYRTKDKAPHHPFPGLQSLLHSHHAIHKKRGLNGFTLLDGQADKKAVTPVTRIKGMPVCSNIGTIRDYALQEVLAVLPQEVQKRMNLA